MKAVAALFLLSLAGPAWADLHWDNPEQAFSAKPTDRAVVARFRFTNAGKDPVTIDAVKTSCGCTTASLDKKDYAPGESGEIEAKFDVAGRVGHQEKAILVTTKEAPDKPSILRLTVEIPEAVKVEPEMVIWRVGEKPEPKVIRVSVADGSPAKIVEVVTDTPAIGISVEETLPGREATVRITPSDTSRPDGATLLIKTDYPADNPEAHYAYARIK